jgi:hypothetical protein
VIDEVASDLATTLSDRFAVELRVQIVDDGRPTIEF